MPLQGTSCPADTCCMGFRVSTLDRIADSFADAIAAGDFEAAEGWLATARYVERRESDMRPVPLDRRVRSIRRTPFRLAS